MEKNDSKIRFAKVDSRVCCAAVLVWFMQGVCEADTLDSAVEIALGRRDRFQERALGRGEGDHGSECRRFQKKRVRSLWVG